MDDADQVAKGARRAAASALHKLVDFAAKEQLTGLGSTAAQARFAALIKGHVAQPG